MIVVRSVYIVTYDICEPKRLHDVYKTMRGYGDHIQYSVFRCELSAAERIRMIGDLVEVMDQVEDQVLIVLLGPAEGFAKDRIQAVGKPYLIPERHAVVV